MSEFNNENVTVTVENTPYCTASITVTVLPELATKAYNLAAKKVGKKVSLPGFRKGKVPQAIFEKQYSDEIHDNFLNIVINDAIQEAMNLTKIFPFHHDTKVKIGSIESFTKDNGGTFKAEYEHFPVVPDIHPADLKIANIEARQPTEEQIDKHIEIVRIHHANLEDVIDRPAQEGDIVDLEVSPMDKEENKQPYNNVHLAHNMIEDEVRQAVIGLKVGQTAENITPPETRRGRRRVQTYTHYCFVDTFRRASRYQ